MKNYECIEGRCVRVGNDEAGNPRLIIETGQHELAYLKQNPLFRLVKVLVEIDQPATKDEAK